MFELLLYAVMNINVRSLQFCCRVKVKELIDFIQDDNRLREERKKAKKNRDKYIGVSSDTMGFRSSCGGKAILGIN